jgi:hypothetical protein
LEQFVRTRRELITDYSIVGLVQLAKSLDVLYKRHPEAKQLVEHAELATPESQLRWLPIQGREFWTVLLDANGGPPLAYLPLDPYDS